MTHKFSFLNIAMLLVGFLFFQTETKAAIGDWTIYSSYYEANKVVGLNNYVFVLCDGRLYSYDKDDTSVETYDKAHLLNGNNIYDILPCKETNELVIVYEDGNIDLMNTHGYVYNMPELQLKTLEDKTINDVLLNGTSLYISTNSGIVVFDVKARVVRDYLNLGHRVNSVAVDEGILYAVCNNYVCYGDLSKNLLDKNNWTGFESNDFDKIINFNGHFYCYTKYELYDITDKQQFTYNKLVWLNIIHDWNIIGDKLFIFTKEDKTLCIDKVGQLTSYDPKKGISYLLADSGDKYWATSFENGLCKATLSGSEFSITSVVPPFGPRRNYAYKINMLSDRMLLTGGAFVYPEVQRKGTIMQLKDGKWSSFDEDGPISRAIDGMYYNVTDVVQDPNKPEHFYASAACVGLLEFNDGKFKELYNQKNSPLASILPDDPYADYYVRVTGLSYDKDGNLWMLNNQSETIVRVLQKDGKWTSFYFDEIAEYPTFDQVLIDQRGWAWINSRRSTSQHNAGVLIFNNNGTLNKETDDKHRFISTIRNQDGIVYTPVLVNCITEDRDGSIWIGTDVGPFMTKNPETVFNSDFNFNQVKVPRNDGTNYADYLLNGVQITCIAYDGGNRKWFGTANNGVYLTSADGTEIIEHFTSDNSPLISDQIFSISIDGHTGEVFIATYEGLVSYRGSSTEPELELDENNVRVYPNPVRPDYDGPVVITGLVESTDVKIVNAAGYLVNQGTSVGGEYTWNARTSDGKRLPSGVYYVLAADKNGNNGVAAKFLMVK